MQPDKNPQKIQTLFNEISPNYDNMNNLISFGTHYLIKSHILRKMNIEPNSNILDLCCGTGDFTQIISKISPTSKIIGLDFSQNMIKLAQQKNPKNSFILGDVTDLPFEDNQFDYITMGFGLRNIENRQKAIEEIYRVLSKGGKFLHLDFGKHNLLSGVFDIAVPILSKIFSTKSNHYQYLINSKNTYPEPAELIKEFEFHGFKYEKKFDYIFGSISAQIMEK